MSQTEAKRFRADSVIRARKKETLSGRTFETCRGEARSSSVAGNRVRFERLKMEALEMGPSIESNASTIAWSLVASPTSAP
jgi:hypothetical protein